MKKYNVYIQFEGNRHDVHLLKLMTHLIAILILKKVKERFMMVGFIPARTA